MADSFTQTSVAALLADMCDEANPRHIWELSRPMMADLSDMQPPELGMPLVQTAPTALENSMVDGVAQTSVAAFFADRRTEPMARAGVNPADQSCRESARSEVVVLLEVGSSALGQLAICVVVMSQGSRYRHAAHAVL